MSWINWFIHTVVKVLHRDGLSRSFWICWTLLNTMHLFGGLHLIQTGSKASHKAGDCFCTSWQHNYSMVTRLHVSGHRNFWRLQNVGVYRKCARRSGIITAATGVSSSLGGVTDSNAENRRRQCHMPEKERSEDERMQHISNAVLCWRRVWHAPRVGTNARVISEWAGAECD